MGDLGELLTKLDDPLYEYALNQICYNARQKMLSRNGNELAIVCGATGCLSLDTRICTSRGIKTLDDLIGKSVIEASVDVKVFDFLKKKTKFSYAIVKPSGIKKVFLLKTSSGKSVKATGDHKFFVKTRGRIVERPLRDIKIGDEICIV